jgi:S1-C subfamily serine protease
MRVFRSLRCAGQALMENQTDNTRSFPIIHTLQGGPSEDGDVLLVEAATFDDKVLRFAIPVDNVQHFIAFLLIWVGKISAAQESHTGTDGTEGAGCLPIPATSISIGEPHGSEGYLGISVGRAELTFSVPASALVSVGQSLLLVGAMPGSLPS